MAELEINVGLIAVTAGGDAVLESPTTGAVSVGLLIAPSSDGLGRQTACILIIDAKTARIFGSGNGNSKLAATPRESTIYTSFTNGCGSLVSKHSGFCLACS